MSHLLQISLKYLQLNMGQLPVARLSVGRPFLHTGVDFASLFILMESLRRNARTYKAYLCIFVCMTVKAVHLAHVTSLTTEGFLDALEQFISRRGLCQHIYSNCGTNFVGVPGI